MSAASGSISVLSGYLQGHYPKGDHSQYSRVASVVYTAIVEESPGADLDPRQLFERDLDLDSISKLSLIIAVETGLGIKINDRLIDRLQDEVGRFVDLAFHLAYPGVTGTDEVHWCRQ